MIRSLLGGSALLVLVVASLTWGQGGSPAPKLISLTVQEPGRTPQVCTILKVWTQPDGSRGYQVQAQDTGERMTVLESLPTGSKSAGTAHTATSRVFRYGASPTPPPGVPAPPANAMVLNGVISEKALVPPSATAARKTEVKPAPTPTVAAPTKIDTKPAPQPTSIVAAPTKTDLKATTPQPTSIVAAPTKTDTKTATPPGSPYATNPAPTTVATNTATTPTLAKTAPAPAEKAPDWRQSWGRVDQVRTADQIPRQSANPNMPVARKQGDDPIQQPAQYTPMPAKMEKIINTTPPTTATLAAQAPTTQQPALVVAGTSGTPGTGGQIPAPIPVKKEEPKGILGLFTPKSPVKTAPMTSTSSETASATGPGLRTSPTYPTITSVPPTPVVAAPVTVPSPAPTPVVAAPVTVPLSAPVMPLVPPPAPTVAMPTVAAPTVAAPTVAPPIPPTPPRPITPPALVVASKPEAPPPIVSPTPVPPKPAPVPTEPVKQPQPPARTVIEEKPGSSGRSSPMLAGSMSIMAVNSREFKESPPVIGPDGRPVMPGNAFAQPEPPPLVNLPEGMANAFTPAVGGRPIPADMMRKDLMPPELVAMLEGRYRPKNGPLGPFAPPLVPGDPRQLAMAQPHPTTPTPAPVPAPVPAPAPAPVPAPVQQVSGAAAIAQLRSVLKDALLPSEREVAAEHLARYEPYRTPEAVEALLTGARSDPAMTVRIACVRGLGSMRANTPAVVDTLRALSREGDERLRPACKEVVDLLCNH
jgi:hypothetical protein